MRTTLCGVLSTDAAIETVTSTRSLTNIVASVQRHSPALVVLVMGNSAEETIDAARRIMGEAPKPIVLVASAHQDSEQLLARSGALAALEPPADAAAQRRFVATLKAMAEVKVVRRWGRDRKAVRPLPLEPAAANGRLVAIASSTGGPGALQQIFAGLPQDFPAPILVVQHIAGGFADSLVRSLGETALKIKLAENGESLKAGTVYIAPDNRHLAVSARGTVALSSAPPVEGFRPSATFLFESAAEAFGSHLTAVVLTGMGRDGVAGLQIVHERGGRIIAQDRETSAVFGMPKAAVENGFVDRVLPIGEIANELVAGTRPEGVSA